MAKQQAAALDLINTSNTNQGKYNHALCVGWVGYF